MRILKESRIKEWAKAKPKAGSYLARWIEVVWQARWRHFPDLRRDFPSADQVLVRSGRIVVVFDVCGGSYRMIAAVHYNTGFVFMLRFLTHAEYDKDHWKNEL